MVSLRSAIYAKLALPAQLLFLAIVLTLHQATLRWHPAAEVTGTPSWKPASA
jgi:hypothetical protein